MQITTWQSQQWCGTSLQHKLVAAIFGGRLFRGSVLPASAAPVVKIHTAAVIIYSYVHTFYVQTLPLQQPCPSYGSNSTDRWSLRVLADSPPTPASAWRATGEDLLAIETMQHNSPRRSVNDVNTASAMGSGGASGRRRREAPKVVIKRNPHSIPGKVPVLFRGPGLRVAADDLKELDMDLLDARASAQNRPLCRIIAKHGATLP